MNRVLSTHVCVNHRLSVAWLNKAMQAGIPSVEIFCARQGGVRIMLENIPNQRSTAERLTSYLKITQLDLKFMFDVGHAHIGGGVEQELEIMKQRIRSTHVHDNDGEKDIHLFPMLAEGGTVDWKKTMKLLRSRGDQYPLLLELREVNGMEAPLDCINQVFDGLEGLPS